MPIVTLQRRLREVGRIRIGEAVPATKRDGTPTIRPVKLEHFRLTSRDQQIIEAAAVQYGGTVEPWTAPDGQQWEVKTSVDQMPVVVPPSEMAFSQYFEQWSAGGCKVRCDGQWDYLADKACHCDPERRACAFHTRLSVMLPDLPGVGLWRLDTSGYYAATELAGVVDLCMAAAQRGQFLPARLRLEQRRVLRDGKTNKFAVPVLDVDVHPLSLTGQRMVGPTDTMGELPAGALTPVPAALPAAPVASIADQAAQVDDPAARSRRANAAEPLKPTGLKPRRASSSEGTPRPRVAEERDPAPGHVSSAVTVVRPCPRCGESLVNADLEPYDGKWAHKGCRGAASPPISSGEGEPVDAGATRASEGAPPPPVDRLGDIDICKLAEQVFAAAKETAPRGRKSKVVDECRHALGFAVTKGRTGSLKEMTADEKLRLFRQLEHLQSGFYQWRIDGELLVFSHEGESDVQVPLSVEAVSA